MLRVTSLLHAAARGLLVTVAAVGFAARAGAQSSPIATLFSTGVLADGSRAADGLADLHYQAYNWTTAGTLGSLLGPAYLIANGYQDYYPARPSQTSRYIWASAGGSDPANVAFRTTFDLTGFDLATVKLLGQFAADNDVFGVYLNGVLVNSANPGFAVPATLSLTSGFASGLNTLDFYVNNSGGPAGFIFGANGAGSPPVVNPPVSTVPEPGSVVLLAAGLAGVMVVGRRVRTA